MSRWTTEDIPPQRGRTAVVTGAAGLGFETARALARAGAQVILASRNPATGAEAIARIKHETPSALVRFEAVDLGDLGSVAALAGRLSDQIQRLDLLINNAGVMTPPRRMETADGFELQFGANYLGHFALTALLLPLLMNAGQARVVTVSSVAARQGRINFSDLQAREDYNTMLVYAQSKLACLMFAQELQRRSQDRGWGVASMAAHPGISRTRLLYNAPGGPTRVRRTLRALLWFMFQPAPQGALPQLFAATASAAEGGAYYGPDGFAELNGFPTKARMPRPATDETACVRLWEVSEDLTGVRFPGQS
ncbi:SDR family oxidoreductase [Phenylobacterium sp.]|uniref:SDR family oxidoreductase n=1 Tax=Phenylobacterium sp. TaxID=1871053 RepID=UPI00273077D0|nr:SDR family oxidoreductase [Phenylobacterium sp.]MDP1617973.1 SDR family oxidoreductase [Phenylobacterium sp.]MDP1988808.1 SDR family oxidoreductase [Phenylobacterium sp.]